MEGEEERKRTIAKRSRSIKNAFIHSCVVSCNRDLLTVIIVQHVLFKILSSVSAAILNAHESDHRNFSPVAINPADRARRLGKVCLICVLIWCPVCAPNAKPLTLPPPPPCRYQRVSISRGAVRFIRNYLMSHFRNWGIFFRNLLTTRPSSRRD